MSTVRDLLSINGDDGRRLLTLRNHGGQLVAAYDPVDLDAAAQLFFDTVVRTVPEDIAELVSIVEDLVSLATHSCSDEDTWRSVDRAEEAVARYRPAA